MTSCPTSTPTSRDAVAAFGDMSSLAISMFGGYDPGEVDESDPVPRRPPLAAWPAWAWTPMPPRGGWSIRRRLGGPR